MNKLKKKFLFLLILVIIGIVMGIIFSNILSSTDKELVTLKISDYFNSLKEDIPINYGKNLLETLKGNIIYLIVIWILGLSIIGLLVNNFILFFKSFVLGFSIGSIINIYLYSGILLSILYIFPSLIINLIVYLIITYFANDFSLKLFHLLFLKKEIKFSSLMKKYIKLLIISLVILVFSSIIETFLTPIIIKLFAFLIK